MENVNWTYLAKAIDHYKGLGYTYVEVPWAVPMDVSMITCPTRDHAYEIKHGDALVGSAEQSLMWMTINGDLPTGRYVACSPCFRDEPTDSIHQKQFMKVELFDSLNVNPNYSVDEDMPHHHIGMVTQHALGFMNSLGIPIAFDSGLEIVDTNSGYDIELYGIELGSYGQRNYTYQGKQYSHIYGTGLAEPRFSLMQRTMLMSRLKS